MKELNFVKIGLVTPKIKLGDVWSNAQEIIKIIENDEKNAVLVFPELTITGYNLGDWIFNRQIIDDAKKALDYIVEHNDDHLIILGSILEYNNCLYDVAYIIQGNDILGIVPKVNLTRNKEYNEQRYFTNPQNLDNEIFDIAFQEKPIPFGKMLFKTADNALTFGVEIGENNNDFEYAKNGAEVVFNITASTFNTGKNIKRVAQVTSASITGHNAYLSTSTGVTETSSDIMFSGDQIGAVDGELILNVDNLANYMSVVNYIDIDLEAIKYRRLTSGVSIDNNLPIIIFDNIIYEEYHLDTYPCKTPFITNDSDSEDILHIISNAIFNRLTYSHAKGLVLGISGGLDSTLALLMCVYMCDRFELDRKIIHAITMPALATGSVSKSRAIRLMDKLGVDMREINIHTEVEHHLELIGHNLADKDITYENAQARYRTYVLMDLANKLGSLVIGTGDMSEIALGFATFNGDHMSMYNVNAGLPKTAIRNLTKYFIKHYPEAETELIEVCNAMISPELTSTIQSSEDFLGKYEVNDFILYHILANGASREHLVFLLMEVFKLSLGDAETYYDRFIRRFKAQQYKRLSGPEGIKVFEVSLCQRGDLKMPGDLY